MARYWLSSLFLLGVISQLCLTQTLPRSLKTYLDRNYRGWKLAGSCYEKEFENTRVLVADFDGNGSKDYAVKFVRKDKGYLVAFLAAGTKWKPLYLHIWKDPDDAKYSDLLLFEKGPNDWHGPRKLRFDAPADFRCESDVGGVHVYRNGKFIAY